MEGIGVRLIRLRSDGRSWGREKADVDRKVVIGGMCFVGRWLLLANDNPVSDSRGGNSRK